MHGWGWVLHFVQFGRSSSHFILRLRQALHPILDFPFDLRVFGSKGADCAAPVEKVICISILLSQSGAGSQVQGFSRLPGICASMLEGV